MNLCKECYWNPIISTYLNSRVKEIWCPIDGSTLCYVPKKCSHFVDKKAMKKKVRRTYVYELNRRAKEIPIS